VPDHLVEHALLGLEIEIDRALGDARPGRDVLQPGRGIAALDEFLEGRVEDLGRSFCFPSGAFLDLGIHSFRLSDSWWAYY
jgi:hypothetical protein